MITFQSGEIELVGEIDELAKAELIKQEPMFWRADMAFALKHGGPITKAFLAKVMEAEISPPKSAVIDSRVHMLKPGWYPAIPGWHLDDIPRTRIDGQPNYAEPEYKSHHYAAVLDDRTMSQTQFLRKKIKLPHVPVGNTVWDVWNRQINLLLELASPNSQSTFLVMNGAIFRFGYGDFHRATPAMNAGWRMFIRASFNTNVKHENEIRKQTQVYLPAVEAGW